MGRPSGMSPMVHDYKERKKKMKEAGRYWEMDTGGDFIKITADIHPDCDGSTLSLSQGDSGDGIDVGIEDLEDFIEVLHTAKNYLQDVKKDRSR